MKIKLLLISKMENRIEALKKQLHDEEIAVLGESAGGADALEQIESRDPDMVIISMTEGDMDALNLTERIITYRPKCFVILVVDTMNITVLQSAMQVGAHNITALHDDAKQFSDYVKSVYNSESLRIRSLSEHQNMAWSSQVITVFSAKGGVGKTSLAVNLAVALAEKGKKVAIVDLDLQFGDAPIFMDMEPRDTISELMQETYSLNIDMIRSYMTMHSSGVQVLCAPKSPEYAETVAAKRVQSLLNMMRSYYDFVIVDTASVLSDVTLTAVESSSKVLFVINQDITALKNSRLAMNLFESLQQKDKFHVVVNRAEDSNTIKAADIEKVLGEEVKSIIPSDTVTAVNALNKGIPFVTGAANSKLSQAVKAIAKGLLEGEAGSQSKKDEEKDKPKKGILFGRKR